MRSVVEGVIYFYLFICVTLLVFNILYIARSTSVSKAREGRIRQWGKELAALPASGELTERQGARLKKIENLMAFQAVLAEQMSEDQAREILRNNRPLFRSLALFYGKKPAMERAFFAYVIASFHPPVGEGHEQMAEILLRYLDNSTVYCRENVLHALYALGSAQAVEHAFTIMSQNSWYHSPKLISDGMVRFSGDRTALVRRLWNHRADWEECLVVGTVQFASLLPSDDFAADFLEALRKEELTTEAKFALVRYFQRHRYAPAGSVLRGFLESHTAEEGQLAVASAAALAAYPGEETRDALKQGLHSRNWYVRRNAAQSLVRLGLTPQEEEAIRAEGDRYANDMLDYALETAAPASGGPAERKGAAI